MKRFKTVSNTGGLVLTVKTIVCFEIRNYGIKSKRRRNLRCRHSICLKKITKSLMEPKITSNSLIRLYIFIDISVSNLDIKPGHYH